MISDIKGISNKSASQQIEILSQYKDIVDMSSIVSKTDPSGKITFVNDKFCEISKYSQEELLGKNHRIVRDPSVPKDVFKDMWKTISAKKIWKGQIKNRAKDGSIYYVEAMICPILDENDNILEYIALRNDVTELVNPKKQLLDAIEITENPLLVLLSVENYKTLEYIYSDNIVNKINEQFYNNMQIYLPDGCKFDKIFNLDNGEFALLKNSKEKIDVTAKELQLKKFQQNIKQKTIIVDEYHIDISVLISFSAIKDHIFENVKYGLEVAKQKHIDIVFANHLIEKAKEKAIKNTNVIKMIQKAIDNGKIVSYFQPIVNNTTLEIEKYESLVRLIDEDGKVISPYFFLDIAKQGSYYAQITNIVIDNSFAALQKTTKEISINLSALDIENIEIRNKLIFLITQNMADAHRIVFELLEDEVIKNFEIVKDFISLVKTFGCQIAIDDFGAGVSNFERLLDFQPDILKIDACLIKNIDKDKYSRDVVETLQLFAWKQKLKTVSEFVASPEILQTVTDIGINYSQGFLLGKPAPLEELQDKVNLDDLK